MRVPVYYIAILLFCSSLLLIIQTATAIDTINTTQSIRDGDNITSSGGNYVLGFFSPGNSKHRFLGIWYGKISVLTAVWVANREAPLNDSSGVLRLTDEGILVLLNRTGSVIWSSNTSTPARNAVAQLLDSGNLVVKEKGDHNLENLLWQSFEHLSDTLLPEMKLGRNRITGMDWYITSWKSTDDPSRGNVSEILVPYGYPEILVMENSIVRHRSGPWNGLRFSGTPQLKPNPMYTFEFVYNEKEIFYRYHVLNSSMLTRLVVTQNGDIQRFAWISRTQSWIIYLTVNTDNCERYALCGANGICSIDNSPVCNCLNGFVPNVQSEWEMMDWSSGCLRRTPLNCSGDGFRQLSGVKLPETKTSWFNKSMNLEECRNTCLKNCSCTAFSNLDIRNGGSGCLLWFGDLIDIRIFVDNKPDIYVRMAASELVSLCLGIDNGGAVKINAKSNMKKRIIVSTALSTGILFLFLALFWYIWKKKQQKKGKVTGIVRSSINNPGEDLDLPLFYLDTLTLATNNFSVDNKLGEGGFGAGTLKDGQEIAVKRLSKNSRQGLDEFKNEVKYMVKLQHRNLVKLLGCCIEGDEYMLIYEFLPNKSLNFFIFDETHSLKLDWPKRYNIINGIARGLLYLHQDSRLRVIHRDLKASNVLLDYEMNPKISDFGLARSLGGNETEANTNKVVGTYGYISPEYAIDGLYSPKSDVFSFGVLVLEILSGNRNRGFCHPDHNLNLLGHAWKLFTEGRPLELVSESIVETCNLSEALRLIHVGLLCVQENPEDRPTMSYVVLMLGNEDALPRPKQPGFYTERDLIEAAYTSNSSQSKPYSANECSISMIEAR
eukprot:XP_024449141.1 G-type lectin S-receptor-like serine/threonine-protein kinase At4g27290 [Populus trichocarpa]